MRVANPLVVLFGSAILGSGGCIFGLSADTEQNSDVPRSDGSDVVEARDTAGHDSGDTTSDAGPVDAIDGSDAVDVSNDVEASDASDSTGRDASDARGDADDLEPGPNNCPGGEGPPVERPDVGTADTSSTDTDGFTPSRPLLPRAIFVGSNGKSIVFVDAERAFRTIDFDHEVTALGPAVHWDRDGILEIPYAINDGDDGPDVELAHPDPDAPNIVSLDEDISQNISYTRLAIADFDDNCRPDIVYPNTGWQISLNDSAGLPRSFRPTPADPEASKAKPVAFLGAFDRDDDGAEELYWYDSQENIRYVSQTDPAEFHVVESDVTIGTGNNAGVGGPRRLEGDSAYRWPFVDDSGRLVTASTDWSSSQRVTAGGGEIESKATPVALTDYDGGSDEELVFVDSDGALSYLDFDGSHLEGAIESPTDSAGNDILPYTETGIVPGISTFYGRMETN